jgi:hypothetical protein
VWRSCRARRHESAQALPVGVSREHHSADPAVRKHHDPIRQPQDLI